MNYCNHCEVHIREQRNDCILCGNPLEPNGSEKAIFPEIPPYYKRHLAIRIMLFISIITVVLSFAIDAIFPSIIGWPILLLFALISIWLGLVSIMQRQYNIPKKILRQVAVISLLALFWDWKIGWRGWSLDYVIPIACIVAMVFIYIVAKVMNLSAKDYITYALIDGLFGILSSLFMIFGWINTIYPTIFCISLSIIFLSALFIFQGKDILQELNKKMHI